MIPCPTMTLSPCRRLQASSCLLLLVTGLLGCGKPPPAYLGVAPKDGALLMATNHEAIHSLALRWTREWSSVPDADARLHELVGRGVAGGAVDSVQAALVGSNAAEEAARSTGDEELRKLFASVAEMEPRLGWVTRLAATNRLLARVTTMAILVGTEVVDASDPNPRGRAFFEEARASLRALLTVSAGTQDPKGEAAGDLESAMLRDQLAAWLEESPWTCVEATAKESGGASGLMKGAHFEFSHAGLRVWGDGAQARHPYRVLKARRSTNPGARLHGTLQVGNTEEFLLQLDSKDGTDVAGLSWGSGAWTLKLVRRH